MRQVSFIAGLIVGLLASPMAVARENDVSAGIRAYANQQYVVASELLEPPAQRGNAIAQTYLGFMYRDGRGVPLDYVEAARWFQAAAEQGEPIAQFFLALLYDKGFGVKRDFVQAETWLDLATAHASRQDRDYWARIRDAVASKLTGDELAQARARALAFAPTRVP
jgi:TPR repeat protein